MPLVHLPQGALFYADHRDPTMHTPPTLLIHGAGGTHLDWPAELRRMPEANAIVVDLPGHGKSSVPSRKSVPAFAADLFALLDALKIGRVVLVGHSMGGAIALTMALQQPERILGLILVATGAKLGVHPEILNGFMNETAATLQRIVNNSIMSNASDQLRRRTLNNLVIFNPATLYNDYSACNAFDVRPELGRVRQPALVIGGTQDKMTPFYYSTYLKDHLPQAELLELNAAHMIALEQPEAVADAVQTWLAAQNFPAR